MISSLLANGLRMTFKFSLSYSALQKKSHILSYDILWSCTAQQARSHGFSVTPPPVFLCVCEWKGGCQYVCESLPHTRLNHFEETANCASSASHMMGTKTGRRE